MGQRGRPKGSKNKRQRSGKNVMDGFLRELPKEEKSSAIDLSTRTGISLKKIVADAMAEGLAVLKTDVYADLIRFNERRGKVIHEKDLEKPGIIADEGLPEGSLYTFKPENLREQPTTVDETDPEEVLHDESADGGLDNGDSVFIPEVERPTPERPGDVDVGRGLGSEIVPMPGSDQEEHGEAAEFN